MATRGSSRHGVHGWTAGAALLVLLLCVLISGCATVRPSAGRATPTATATAAPLTPTPTAMEAQLNVLVRQAAGSVPQQIQTIYHTAGEVEVNLTLAGTVPTADADVSAMQERVKTLCFEAQQAVWASDITPLSQVTVTVLGPVVVLYGDIVTQAYGATVLKSATEKGFAWSALSPEGAWGKYDNAYLRPGYYDPD